MHIPDGYLSPSTCAAMTAAAAPFWVVAWKKLENSLQTRAIPQLALVAAWCFVVMMFNLPLPGGTTGHAVGIGVAAIILGPWGAVLAISAALTVQALFFGDGGILALGANCFNMAICGPFVASAIYGALTAKNRVARPVAGAIAGYLSLNAAALLTALEFGSQYPNYSPYPIAVAVPAMMLGHATFAGLAEAVLTGGVVAWLAKARPELLDAAPTSNRSLRPLVIGLGLLVLLCPLGLLAVGSAWGEWGAADFRDSALRTKIQIASHGQAPPAVAPQGLAKWNNWWRAPLAGYSVPGLSHEATGYILSALAGVFLLLVGFWAILKVHHRGTQAQRR